MIGKKEYTNTIELQLLKKEKASLESKVFRQQQDQESLKGKIQLLEKEKDTLKQIIDRAEKGGVSKINISDVKLRSNIRDEYEYEEIENLALDIMVNAQLQPVLITKDNYLISGHRRFYAINLINNSPETINVNDALKDRELHKPDYIVAYQLDKNSSEISDTELADLQYAENNERRAIDNFQLSRLYNSYLDNGFEQKDLVLKFKKTKGNISSVVALKKIDPQLVKLFKEFQIFAWSKARFIQETAQPMTEIQEQFYQNNKGIIGWKPLYNIAKQEDVDAQKDLFLQLYKNRLSEEEVNSDYFSEALKTDDYEENKLVIINSAIKHTKNLSKTIKKLDTSNPLVNKLLADIQNIEKRLSNMCD